jgi:ABC-type glycerol-3-phosphate transport system substrate-binding protein
VEEFRKNHPDVAVNIEFIPWGQYTDKILTEFVGGQPADVAWIENSHACRLIPKGALLPLNEFLEKDKTISIKDYWPAIVDRYTIDGKIYCIPNDVAPCALVYYNKNLFDKAGVEYPKDDWDWNEFVETAKKLTVISNGKVIQYGFYTTHWNNFVLSAGGQEVDNVKKPRKCLLNTPEALKGVQFYFDLALKHKVMPPQVGEATLRDLSVEQMFIYQKVAMVMTGIWVSGQFEKSITEFDWDVALCPRAPGKKHPIVSTGGSGWGIIKGTKYPEYAWEIVKLLGGEKVQRVAAERHFQPAIIRLSTSPDVWLKCPPKPCHKDVLNQAMSYVVFSPFNYVWWKIDSTIIQPELQKIWEGKKSIKQAFDTIVKEANKVLAEESPEI